MRDFFIRSLEKLVGVLVVLLAIGVVVGAIAAMLAEPAPGQPGGILAALLILVVGGLYVIFVGGFMYLGIGIYQNTKRMADAMERRDV
jgi:hypothetical protein